ncbi:MAG: class I SAM-dependent methyltransferase [Candidatus Rokuibacteriota bacterium]
MSEQQKAQVRAQFGPSAAAYVTSTGHAAGADLEQLLAWGGKRGAARVLDIATGGGHTALAFSRFTPSVVAVDLTLAMLQAAREFLATEGAGNIRVLAADVEALPFRAGSFGTVTCRIAAHHFPALLPPLREVARVLRAGGSFLVQDILGHDDEEASAFIREVERRRDPSHVRAFRQIEWTAFLRAAGLTVMDEAVMTRRRGWTDWTDRMRMTPEARADLERFVLAAPARRRDAFDFAIENGRIVSFSDRMLLLRADRD